MKSLIRLLIIALLLNFSLSDSFASVEGADISWTCVGADSFIIKVNVYNDCNGSSLGNISLNFNCQATGTLITSLNLSTPTPVDITPYCNTSCSRCQSSSCSFPYGIKKYVYQGLVDLTSAGGSCCNVTISLAYGNRSTSITTGAAGTSFYTEAMIKRCQTPCDNSPVFTNPPIQILCSGQEFTYNHGVKDSDYSISGGLSDSLTYEWAQPMSAANTNIAYTGSYAYNKAIYFWGFPSDALPFPRGLHLDTRTGDIQFRPMKPEQTVMVLKVNVFRNGIKIAEVRRELLMIVITCPINYSPSVNTANNVRTKSVCAGQTITYNFSTNDANAGDTVQISWNNGIPGATWTTTNGLSKHPTATLTWTPTDADAGRYPHTFTVTSTDNACPLKSSTTQHYQVIVNPIPEATITISDSGCGKYFFDAFPMIGTSPTYKWSSDSFSFSPDNGSIVSHSFLQGKYPYKVVMTALGCSRTYQDTAYIDTFMSVYLPADTSVCINSTIDLQAMTANVTSPYTLQWGSDTTVFATDTTLSKQITITQDTTIWIRATYGSFSCPYDEINIKVHPVYYINLPEDTFYCSLNKLLPPKFYPKRTAFSSFKWYQDTLPTVIDSDAFLNVIDTGLFSCVATDTFGCVTTDSVRIHKNPAVIANAADTTICYGTYSNIPADSLSGHIYTYKWLLNNVAVSTSRALTVSPPATTDYYLVATETLNGISCSAIHLTTVGIKALPVIKFDPFTNICEFGSAVILDSFVKVNGIRVNNGIWLCADDSALINTNNFLTQNAASRISPGYKLAFGFTDTLTECFNSDTAYLPVYPVPAKPVIVLTGDTTACFGDSIILESAVDYDKYTWSTTATSKKITVKSSGSYSLIATSDKGCVSTSSDTADVIVYPQTQTPVVQLSASDSFLECDLMNGLYEWYFRPDTLPTPYKIIDTARRINPKIYGNNCYFSVIFTDSNGCVSDTSAPYYFINLSVDKNNGPSGFEFYPNPADNILMIENPGFEPVNLIISDIFGRNIIQQKLIPGKNTVDVGSFKPGVYILRFNNSKVYRLVVE